MIKLFRRIRRTLIDAGNPKRYLLYAIGEIILVVVGILIALQINNWNIERINRVEEKAYLNRMILNLNRDLINIKASSEGHKYRLVVGVQTLDSLGSTSTNYFKDREIYTNSLKKYSQTRPRIMGKMFTNILRIKLFYKSDIAFQELLSTGKIDIIKNQELKDAIQDHYLQMAEYQDFQDQMVMTIQTNYRDILNKNNISTISQESYSELKEKFVDPQGIIVALENYLEIARVILNVFIYNDNSCKKMTENLIAQIRRELDNAK